MQKPELSIIILNYNTKDLLSDCLKSIKQVEKEVDCQVIVSDNGSTDGSLEMLKSDFPWVTVIKNKKNLGFAKGNNAAKNIAHGKYILFLNSDTVVYKGVLLKTLSYLKANMDVGALSCKLVLQDGSLDKDTRRRFPTPWISLKKLFFKWNKDYWYGGVPDNVTQEVDVIQGAFFLTSKEVLNKVGWFDEDYFLDGEDIDLCWKIKKLGYKIVYYPEVKILHLKKATKSKFKSEHISRGVDAMEIFYRKRLWSNYPLILNLTVITGIRLLKILRLLKLPF